MSKTIEIHIIGHLEDDAGLYEGRPASYWASAKYKVERLPNGQFELTRLDFERHKQVRLLEAFGLSVDKDCDRTIHINDTVWETHQNGNGIEAKLTQEGIQKIGEQFNKNYECIFKPAHIVN